MKFLKELGIKKINEGVSTGLRWYNSKGGNQTPTARRWATDCQR
jgi:hypothetical protein